MELWNPTRNSNLKRHFVAYFQVETQRFSTLWRFWNASWGLKLWARVQTVHIMCVCVCACVCCLCDRVMVRSASEHCISSSGQVFNLCDPARDYGGSGRKVGLETHPSSLITDSLECICVCVCVCVCVYYYYYKGRIFYLHIVRNVRRNYAIHISLILLYAQGNLIVWASIIVAAP